MQSAGVHAWCRSMPRSPSPCWNGKCVMPWGAVCCSAHIEEKHHHSAAELVHEAESWLVGAARRVPWVKVRTRCATQATVSSIFCPLSRSPDWRPEPWPCARLRLVRYLVCPRLRCCGDF